ncbi:hypothetical protein ACWDR0_02270 [Streptomyces sp. NPDC003691]
MTAIEHGTAGAQCAAAGRETGVSGVPAASVASPGRSRTVVMPADAPAGAVVRGTAAEEDADTVIGGGARHHPGPFGGWERRLPAGRARRLPENLHSYVPTGRCAPGQALCRRTFEDEGADR